MFEAYKIGVRIGVIDATAGGILKIAGQFTKAQREASAFLNTLRAINAELRRSARAGGTSSGFTSAANDAGAPSGRAWRAGRSGPGTGMVAMAAFAGGRSGGGWGSVPPMLPGGQLALGYGGSGGTMAAGFRWPWPGTPGGGGGGGGGGYSYGPWGKLFGGMFIEHAGRDMFGALGGPIDEATKYQQAVARFSLFGLGDKLNADAMKFAKAMNIVGTSMTDAVNFMAEAQGVFRESGLSGPQSLAGAKLAAPVLAKIAFATAGLDDTTRAKMHTQSLDMLRFVEMRGGLSSATTFNRLANEGWKAIRSSGGNVDWSQLRQFMSTGSVAAQGLNDVALFGEMEPIIGEMKGGRAGHAFMTAFSRVNGLQRLMPRIMTREMLRLGLWDPKRIQFNSQGGVKNFIGNPLKSANLFSSSPFEYYQKVVLPAYAKSGITKPQDVYRENAILFGNTGGHLFSIMYRQQQQIQHSVEAQRKTLGIDASANAAKNTFAGQLLNYHKQVENLQIQLGLVALPMLIRGLKWLNPHIKQLGDWIGAHSTLAKGLLVLFAGIAGLAVVGGSIVALAGAFTLIGSAVTAGGGLAALVSSVGTALGGLAATAVVAYAAFHAGTAIYDKYMAHNASGRGLGALEAHILAFFGNKEAQDAVDRMNGRGPVNHSGDFHPERLHYKAGKPGTVIHVTNVHLDGKKISTVVSKHQAKAMAAPMTGTTATDISSAPPPIGLNLSPAH